jgi:hypothetical protein
MPRRPMPTCPITPAKRNTPTTGAPDAFRDSQPPIKGTRSSQLSLGGCFMAGNIGTGRWAHKTESEPGESGLVWRSPH